MSVSARAMTKGKANAPFSPGLSFQRKAAETRSRNVRRHSALKRRHILSLLILQAAVFIVLHEAWIYLLTWDHLKITDVKVFCSNPDLGRDVSRSLRDRPLGNILLCDVRQLQADIQDLAWVRDVRISRIYPSTLRVEIRERRPAAWIVKSSPRLIDREGVHLEGADPDVYADLPLLTDRGEFRFGFEDKLETAWTFLDALPAAERNNVEWIDLTDSAGFSVKFRDDPVLIRVAAAEAQESLRLFRTRRSDWEARFGTLQSVDLRFAGRAVLKPAGPAGPTGEARRPQFIKEADNAQEQLHRRH